MFKDFVCGKIFRRELSVINYPFSAKPCSRVKIFFNTEHTEFFFLAEKHPRESASVRDSASNESGGTPPMLPRRRESRREARFRRKRQECRFTRQRSRESVFFSFSEKISASSVLKKNCRAVPARMSEAAGMPLPRKTKKRSRKTAFAARERFFYEAERTQAAGCSAGAASGAGASSAAGAAASFAFLALGAAFFGAFL